LILIRKKDEGGEYLSNYSLKKIKKKKKQKYIFKQSTTALNKRSSKKIEYSRTYLWGIYCSNCEGSYGTHASSK